MSDSDLKFDRSTGKDGTSRLEQAGSEVKQRVAEATSAAADAARKTFDEVAATAKETVANAGEKIQQQATAGQSAGAEYAARFASNIRGAAKAFAADTPVAARTIEMAADYVEDAAAKLRNGSLRDVVDGMSSFARRQPAAFLGLSVLAGFAAVRFLKAGAPASDVNQRKDGAQ